MRFHGPDLDQLVAPKKSKKRKKIHGLPTYVGTECVPSAPGSLVWGNEKMLVRSNIYWLMVKIKLFTKHFLCFLLAFALTVPVFCGEENRTHVKNSNALRATLFTSAVVAICSQLTYGYTGSSNGKAFLMGSGAASIATFLGSWHYLARLSQKGKKRSYPQALYRAGYYLLWGNWPVQRRSSNKTTIEQMRCGNQTVPSIESDANISTTMNEKGMLLVSSYGGDKGINIVFSDSNPNDNSQIQGQQDDGAIEHTFVVPDPFHNLIAQTPLTLKVFPGPQNKVTSRIPSALKDALKVQYNKGTLRIDVTTNLQNNIGGNCYHEIQVRDLNALRKIKHSKPVVED